MVPLVVLDVKSVKFEFVCSAHNGIVRLQYLDYSEQVIYSPFSVEPFLTFCTKKLPIHFHYMENSGYSLIFCCHEKQKANKQKEHGKYQKEQKLWSYE